MYTIATLYQLRRYLGLASADPDDDDRLLSSLQSASAEIERLANRSFNPRLATLQHSVNLSDATELLLDDDLLELSTLVNGDGNSIGSGDILTIPGGDSPISVIRLTGGNAFVWDETPVQAVSVTGIWGWHSRPSQMWRDSADSVQDNPLSSSTSTLTVSDADGVDGVNESPRFQIGQLLRIEDEYLRVLDVDTAANTLTVLRGVNGTTAASHVQNTDIDTYQPPPDVGDLVVRWAAWIYRQPDAFDDILPTLLKTLYGLQRVRVEA